jgi:ribosomal protein RSM22 (predicted rRNA methylase)
LSDGLPAPLKAALDAALEGVSRKDLAERAARTSAAYRAGKPSAGVIRDRADALAYALVRLPATYAAASVVLAEARRMAPGFAPVSLLDAGCGPGGGSWAAVQTWPSLEAVTWLDASDPFLDLAAELAGEGPLGRAVRRKGDLGADVAAAADLVLASYALAEVPHPRQTDVVERLWQASAGVLALVEPGTPDGYARILAARDVLIRAGAAILAPCPHTAACPLVAPDWCHFSVRLPRSRDHLIAKAAEVPFEDERFAYLVAARPHVVARPRTPRVLAPPRLGKAGVALKLCTEAGVEARLVARRDKAAHAIARRLDWGDALGL